jgi:hypothetical protein
MKRLLLILLVASIGTVLAKPQGAAIRQIIVESGEYLRINTPISADLTGINLIDSVSYKLFEKISGALIEKPCQVETGYSHRLWWILDGTTRPGETREYLFTVGDNAHKGNKIAVTDTHDAIILKKGVSEILQYHKAVLYPPDNVDTVYKRSGFIHPLRSPSGNVMTRVSPPDHYHHMGIWNPWTKVRIGDHVTDFWNLYEKQGTVQFAGVNSLISGDVFGGFSVKQDHIDFQGKTHKETIINEVWDVRSWYTEPVKGTSAYLVDITTFLSLAVDFPVTLEAYRYGGGIGIRANEEWTNKNSRILTSEGKTRVNADGSRAKWVDLNGEFSNKSKSGIIFFSHPSNREYPEPMRVWPEDANEGRGDVYFEFCPIRYKEWILNPGSLYRLKYRILVYDGSVDRDTAERLWNDFAYPPMVRLLIK